MVDGADSFLLLLFLLLLHQQQCVVRLEALLAARGLPRVVRRCRVDLVRRLVLERNADLCLPCVNLVLGRHFLLFDCEVRDAGQRTLHLTVAEEWLHALHCQKLQAALFKRVGRRGQDFPEDPFHVRAVHDEQVAAHHFEERS